MIKIRYYLKNLRDTKDIFDECILAVESRIIESFTSASTFQQFLKWFEHIFAIKNLSVNSKLEILIRYIQWAQKVKSHYLDFLKTAFSDKVQSLPRWVYTIFKLKRYDIAFRALVQLAYELSALLNPMIVESVTASSRTSFTIFENEISLICVLRRIVEARTKKYISRLASVWNVVNVENHFRRACSLNLIVHAEMQLVNFYDHNRQCKSFFRFIEVSKKSCYLCHMFLTTHLEFFCVSSCHQKLYLSWISPPTTDLSVYRQYKAIIRELSKLMKAAAKHDLADRLDDERRSVSSNFTVKISLSDLTKPAGMRTQILAESQNNFQLRSNTAMNENIAIEEAVTIEKETFEPASSFRSIDVVSLTPYMKTEPITLNRTEVATSTEWFLTNNSSISILTMIFHFIRTDDVNKQDIISMRDIFDSSTNCSSWVKLLEILKTDHDLRMTFKESQEVLMINNQIRVNNERQFLACLQYLHNSNISNSKTLVYDVSELAFSKNELTLHQLWHFSKKLRVSQKRHWLLFEQPDLIRSSQNIKV